MWGTALGINSFIIWPISFIFLVYSVGHAILFQDWKTLVIAIVVFILASIAEVILGILA